MSDEECSNTAHSMLDTSSTHPKKNLVQGTNKMKSCGQQTISSSECNLRINNPRHSVVSFNQTSVPAPEALKSKSKREQEISLAVTLVLIALVFICCQSVKLIADVYEIIYCERPSAAEESFLTMETGEYCFICFLF